MFHFTEDPAESDFFVQLKGTNAGQPLREKIRNSIGIKCTRADLQPEYFFYVIMYLFLADKFKARLKGSVIPYIRQSDITEEIINYFVTR